jgi:hypothetical protein
MPVLIPSPCLPPVSCLVSDDVSHTTSYFVHSVVGHHKSLCTKQVIKKEITDTYDFECKRVTRLAHWNENCYTWGVSIGFIVTLWGFIVGLTYIVAFSLWTADFHGRLKIFVIGKCSWSRWYNLHKWHSVSPTDKYSILCLVSVTKVIWIVDSAYIIMVWISGSYGLLVYVN